MGHIKYLNRQLMIEKINVADLAAEIGTPFYCYSTSTIEKNFLNLKNSLDDLSFTICYSIKANSNLAVISELGKLGAGADVVSGGELLRAQKANIPPQKIVFSGVGKTKHELAAAIDSNILQINIESDSELEQLQQVAKEKNKIVDIGIRVNPDVDAKSHDKISTGRKADKFGIEIDKVGSTYTNAQKAKNINPTGLAVHIGSQITSLEPYKIAFNRLNDLTKNLQKNGCKIKRIDIGGGLGIQYDEGECLSICGYGKLVKEILGNLGCQIILEPGRYIVGNAGILVTKVIYIKVNGSQTFVIVDAAMNDLMRPSLYGARHKIKPLTDNNQSMTQNSLVNVVGPVCETGDTFATQVSLPNLNENDLLAIESAGAYGAVMSSAYNSRPIIPEAMVKEGRFELIRNQINTDDLLNFETIPTW